MNDASVPNVTTTDGITHPDLVDRYDKLMPGGEMEITHAHDPKPLYYQLLNHRGHEFSWEYLQKGPNAWKVKITKQVPAKQTVTLGQMAAKDYRNAQIFSRYGLNFCCNG